MRRALSPLRRYIAANRIGKRLLMTWQGPEVCPSDLTIVFAFDDEYAMGVLASGIHGRWAWARSSTMRMDLRYTPTSAFDTFPWPQPDPVKRETIAELTRQVLERRHAICAEREIGLTTLYNKIDDGAYVDLAEHHRHLDRAVAAAYGWPASAAADPAESNERLLELNRRIAAEEIDYHPFAFLRQGP